MNIMNQSADLGHGSVGKLLFKLALPAIVAQIINVLYNMVDRMYIGHIPDYVESKETILLSFKGKREDLNGIALIDKKDGNARVLENIKFDDNFRWLPKQFFSLDEGWCAMLMYPEDVLKKEEFARRFPGLDEESNPVLFIGKLR